MTQQIIVSVLTVEENSLKYSLTVSVQHMLYIFIYMYMCVAGMLAFNGSPTSPYLPVPPASHAMFAMGHHQPLMMSSHTAAGSGYPPAGALSTGQSPLHDGLGHIQDVHAG